MSRVSRQMFLDAILHAQLSVFGRRRMAVAVNCLVIEFFLKVVDARIVFMRDPAGAVEALVLHQGGREMRDPKKK